MSEKCGQLLALLGRYTGDPQRLRDAVVALDLDPRDIEGEAGLADVPAIVATGRHGHSMPCCGFPVPSRTPRIADWVRSKVRPGNPARRVAQARDLLRSLDQFDVPDRPWDQAGRLLHGMARTPGHSVLERYADGVAVCRRWVGLAHLRPATPRTPRRLRRRTGHRLRGPGAR
ncbi:hypothetical protein [Lentzea sp. CA-135723]|uniref:hypothetical protein n=1 Tax=Lentzea sp. CA-135723 TaxID=3239950 RepID=UPI003D901218